MTITPELLDELDRLAKAAGVLDFSTLRLEGVQSEAVLAYLNTGPALVAEVRRLREMLSDVLGETVDYDRYSMSSSGPCLDKQTRDEIRQALKGAK